MANFFFFPPFFFLTSPTFSSIRLVFARVVVLLLGVVVLRIGALGNVRSGPLFLTLFIELTGISRAFVLLCTAEKRIPLCPCHRDRIHVYNRSRQQSVAPPSAAECVTPPKFFKRPIVLFELLYFLLFPFSPRFPTSTALIHRFKVIHSRDN